MFIRPGAAGAGVVSIDQGAIRGSRRSNPATYTGLLDPIRKAFAKANGVKPALFSANSEGACPQDRVRFIARRSGGLPLPPRVDGGLGVSSPAPRRRSRRR